MSEEIKNEIVDKLKKEIQPKDYSNELNSLSEKLDSLHEASHKHEHAENTHNDSMKHEHAVHSWDKTCSDCGENNPDYSDEQYQCVDCDEPMGTKDEATKAKACPHCSSDEGAYNEEEGYTF